jgi:hypothetical protein
LHRLRITIGDMMKSILQIVPPRFRTLAKRVGLFALGAVLTVFYAQLAQAQTAASSSTRTVYSPETIIAAIISAVITIFFLRGMYLVLTYASETYGLGDEDDSSNTSDENNVLLYGAFGWVIGSALLIASYGLGWEFLYLGPIICLLGPLVPIVAMQRDLKRYKQVLAARTTRHSVSGQENNFIQ